MLSSHRVVQVPVLLVKSSSFVHNEFRDNGTLSIQASVAAKVIDHNNSSLPTMMGSNRSCPIAIQLCFVEESPLSPYI